MNAYHTPRLLCLLLILAVFLGNLAACTPSNDGIPDPIGPDSSGTDDPNTNQQEDPYMNVPNIDLESLRQTGVDSQRWLSIPESRLVINPYQFNSAETVTHSDYSDRPSLPLNIGYLDPYATGGTGVWLENLITLYEQGDGEGDAAMQYEAELWDSAAWTKSGGSNTELYADDGYLSLTVLAGAAEPWQYAAQRIELDLDQNPVLTITVDSCEGQWALKLCEDGKVDESIVADTSKTGTYTYNLAAALGRGGTFKGVIKIFSIGYDKELVISRMDIRTVTAIRAEATEYTTAWLPSALEFTATYDDGLALSGFDTFYDADTVLRRIEIQKDGDLTVAVDLGASKSISTTQSAITADCGGYSYAVAADRDIKVSYYEVATDMLADVGALKSARGAAYATVTFSELKAGDVITLALTLRSDATSPADVTSHAVSALVIDEGHDAASDARAARDEYWQSYLRRVPRPETFELSVIDTKGVGPMLVEQMYYIAWIFLGQNTLPAAPEIDFPYPQVCCGKPSMWAYGEEKSPYSASWESFFGIQLLGYVMPDFAWSAYEGIMSAVGEDGMLGGESLPSEKAHTAWLLYTLTGDTARLEGVYDAIGRYLDWRIENPRWIYLEHNDVNSADADFVTSALIDIEYMQKIAEILGKDADKAAWENKHADLMQMYYRWNFDEQGNVYQYCNKINLTRSAGCALWCTKGLLVEGLDEEHKDNLLARMRTEYSQTGVFANMTGVKYPPYSHTVLGLFKVGEISTARIMTEIAARDIVRVGMLSENYTRYTDPTPTGVRPAMFGCAMMIESVLLMNGFNYQGAAALNINGIRGSVSNITVRGEILTTEDLK
ncbi:MAG: hypothetical protein IJW40_03305 [Clostridia bacterium]|nr:hypothetical protein [Clostridia bacterium]